MSVNTIEKISFIEENNIVLEEMKKNNLLNLFQVLIQYNEKSRVTPNAFLNAYGFESDIEKVVEELNKRMKH
ncbi:hypothetical protein PBI_PBS1_263 [Bacillus phage PBS1]|uniref:Uncharacterized protein n=1 Tax=Bacillus phage PBS1 TaxID=2884423 RepID=A0A223LDH4_BPPB1|nr:hypothetical protein FK780_gp184 [Bacillus phage PBS1]ASU00085.1 hypothetical protein PBI_PBS1_263 [Bacillus phage PBS1]BDE75406.1 hypothetical protein [Bacillus phage PBS1]